MVFHTLNRREFLKLGALAVGGPLTSKLIKPAFQDFPADDRLGRVTVGRVDLKILPDINSQTIGVLYEDSVVPLLREVVGYNPLRHSQRWVETPDGYIWSPHLQPVKNALNSPQLALPETSLGEGMWAEVTVPWVPLVLDNPPARSPWLKASESPRLYYSQVLWVDQIDVDSQGKSWYRLNERFGYGDIFWASAEAFRSLSTDDLAPISPEVEDKKVLVNVSDQTLSCFESGREVFFCRISTGAKFDASGNAVDKWATPLGPHPIWRKIVSVHMVGGTTGGGFDLPGIGWTSLFDGKGDAIHSTYWHNNFGVPVSHGCVNAAPEDAKWIFRWVNPPIDTDPGDITIAMPGGTVVEVIEY